ncbi:MAG TPA: transcription elongation factor GreA [Bacillota bacterium]
MSEELQQEVLLTPEGLQKLEEELNYLKTVRRKEVAERIKAARDFGDLYENSEYDDAKNEQAFVESRISQIEQILRNARIVTEEEMEPDRVHIGCTVRVRDTSDSDEYTYVLVGSNEGDPSRGRISYQSPVGKALFGRRVGETVEVRTPNGGRLVLEILDVSRRPLAG